MALPRRALSSAPLLAIIAACSPPDPGMTISPANAAWADAKVGCPTASPRLPLPQPADTTKVDFEIPDD